MVKHDYIRGISGHYQQLQALQRTFSVPVIV
jgi:hypothetical protein